MKLGLSVGYWGMGPTQDDQLTLVREAEALGYDSVWAAEAYGSDAVSVLAWLAGKTERIRLGSSIMQMVARTPTMTAMTAATIDQLSGGRMILGLGSSGPQVAEGWHGVRFRSPLARTREYVDVVRMALRREYVDYAGEHISLPLPDSRGRALKLTTGPVQDPVPIYLAAMGPKNVELAGEIADGWLPTLFSPEHCATLRGRLEAGAARAGRSADDVAITPMVNVLVTEDIDAARDALRPYLALYLGGMGSREQNFYLNVVSEYGFEGVAREVQDHYLAGRRKEAAAALTTELIDAVSIVGPPPVVRDRLAAFEEAGVDTVVVTTVSTASVEEKLEQLRLVAEIASPAAVSA